MTLELITTAMQKAVAWTRCASTCLLCEMTAPTFSRIFWQTRIASLIRNVPRNINENFICHRPNEINAKNLMNYKGLTSCKNPGSVLKAMLILGSRDRDSEISQRAYKRAVFLQSFKLSSFTPLYVSAFVVTCAK